jgi:hypothetical protein
MFTQYHCNCLLLFMILPLICVALKEIIYSKIKLVEKS